MSRPSIVCRGAMTGSRPFFSRSDLRRVLAKAAVLLCCAIGAWLMAPPADGMFMVSLVSGLTAVCATAICEWATHPQTGTCVVAACAVATAFLPAGMGPCALAFLPVMAVDAGLQDCRRRFSCDMGRDEARWEFPSLQGVLGYLRIHRDASLCMAAGGVALVRTIPAGIPYSMIGAMGVVASLCIGWQLQAVAELEKSLRLREDEHRLLRRTSMARLAEADEARDEAVRTAQLHERTRIARDIHDNVGHLLTRAIMQTQAAVAVAESLGDGDAAQRARGIAETLDEAMTTIRRSVHDLEDEGTDFAQLMESAAHSLPSQALSVTLNDSVTSAPAPVARCFAIAIRESLNNAVRHGGARHVTIAVRELPALWQLVVQDDGRIVADRPAESAGQLKTSAVEDSTRHVIRAYRRDVTRGMGLHDISARAQSLGGTMTAGPVKTGWRVFVAIPKTSFFCSAPARGMADARPMANRRARRIDV